MIKWWWWRCGNWKKRDKTKQNSIIYSRNLRIALPHCRSMQILAGPFSISAPISLFLPFISPNQSVGPNRPSYSPFLFLSQSVFQLRNFFGSLDFLFFFMTINFADGNHFLFTLFNPQLQSNYLLLSTFKFTMPFTFDQWSQKVLFRITFLMNGGDVVKKVYIYMWFLTSKII